MSISSAILGVLGVGDNPVYSFSQQQRDFLKLQILYAFRLKQRLDAGTITQETYDADTVWAANNQLTPPYVGWYTEFKNAIASEDLDWLAGQIGITVDQLTAYLGDAIKAVASTAGTIVGTVISSATEGAATGFFGSLNLFGWVAIAGVGVVVYYGWKKGLIQKAFKTTVLL